MGIHYGWYASRSNSMDTSVLFDTSSNSCAYRDLETTGADMSNVDDIQSCRETAENLQDQLDDTSATNDNANAELGYAAQSLKLVITHLRRAEISELSLAYGKQVREET